MALNNTYYLNVDVKDRYSGNKPKFRKGDSGVLIFTIFDKGKLVELPQNTTATLYQITSGGNRFSSPCTIEILDGRQVIKYEFKKSDTEDKGYNTVVLVISNGESVISIQPFEVIVYDDFDGGAGSFIDLIQDLMKLVNEMKFNADKTIRTFEKGVPNGVATLDSNGKVPFSQLQIDTDDSHLSETVFMNNVHGMRIQDGYLQYLTPDGYINAGTTPPTPTITASVQVSEGIATVTYQGNLTVSSQKWEEGSRSVSYFNNNGNSFTGNTFSIRGIGIYTLYYIDSLNIKHILEFTVDESMLPSTNVTVVVDKGEVDVTINRPTTIKKWSKGERDIAYFANNGTVFTGNGFTVTEIGIYTIYYKIDSGAEYIYVFEVTEEMLPSNDNIPPSIYKQVDGLYSGGAKSGAVIVRWSVIDGESGLSHVIMPNGVVINYPNPIPEFRITTNGTYTIKAYDNNGNEATDTVIVNNIGTPVVISELELGSRFYFCGREYTLLEKNGNRNLITRTQANNTGALGFEFDIYNSTNLFPNATISTSLTNEPIRGTLDEHLEINQNAQWNYGYVQGSGLNYSNITNAYYDNLAGLLTLPELINAKNNGWIEVSVGSNEWTISPTNQSQLTAYGLEHLSGGSSAVRLLDVGNKQNFRISYKVTSNAIGYI